MADGQAVNGQPGEQVAVSCIVVPDGIVGDKVRLSLGLAPAAGGGGATVNLSTWPSEIHNLCAKIVVFTGSGSAPEGGKKRVGGGAVSFASDLDAYTAGTPPQYDLNAAVGSWQKIMGKHATVTALKAAYTAGTSKKRDKTSSAAYPAAELAHHLVEIHAEQSKLAAAGIAARIGGVDMRQFGELPQRVDTAFWVSLNRILSGRSDGGDVHADRLAKYSRSPKADLVSFAKAARKYRQFHEKRYQASCAAADNPPPVADPVLSRLAGLTAYPTLAKFLGLVVDVYVPLADLPVGTEPAGSEFAVRVALDGTIDSSWTVCRYVPARSGMAAFFGPKARDPATYVDGLLNLRSPLPSSSERRFSLQTLDPTSSLLNICTTAEAHDAADRGGASRADPAPELGPPRASGVALFDRQALPPKPEPDNKPAVEHVLNTEDLVYGYRVDAALGANDVRTRWRPLVARRLYYNAAEIPAAFLGLKEVVAVGARDDGHVRPLRFKDSDCFHEQVFVWTGESLGLPVSHSTEKRKDEHEAIILEAFADNSLPIHLDYDIAPSSSQPLPLREGHGYSFGARLFLANGCSLSFDDAVARYVPSATLPAQPSLVLGEPGVSKDAPYPYLRMTKISAPELLLTTGEKLIHVKDPRTDAPGETAERLVIRPEVLLGVFQGSTMRGLLPPSAPFELVEQHGGFDADDNDVPKGLFEGALKVQTYEPNRLPIAHNGTWDGDTSSAVSRGAVLALNGNATKPAQPYYPDPMARSLRAGFVGSTVSVQADFWKKDAPFTQATPIVLRLTAAGGITPTLASLPSVSVPDESGQSVMLPCIAVGLPQGQSVDLQIWPEPDVATHTDRHHVLNRLRADVPGLNVPRLLQGGPFSPMVFNKTITLVHAVQKPLPFPGAGPWMSVHPVVIQEKPHAPGEVSTAWQSYVTNAKGPEMNWDSVEGGSTTYFVGSLASAGASTGRIRCDAQWLEYSADTVRQDPDGKWSCHAPTVSHTLFAIDDIPKSDQTLDLPLNPPLNLLYSDSAKKNLRGLGYSFVNGAGRILRLRTIATSRFTDCYPPDTSPPPADGGAGKFERQSVSFEDKITIQVPCIFQPPKPEIDKVVPVFRWAENSPHNGVQKIVWQRTNTMRIYLKRPWHVSGEGEQPALLFASDRSDPKRLEKLVSRWGMDLVHQAGGVSDEFAAALPGAIGPLALKTPAGPIKVLVAAKKPTLDPTSGLWFFDVDLDPSKFYFPFVQLAVARYQANAVDGLKISMPQLFWTQIPPRRDIVVTKQAGSVKVTYSGVTYFVGPGVPVNGKLTDVPALNQAVVKMRLMQAQYDASRPEIVRWIPITPDVAVAPQYPKLHEPRPPDGIQTWQTVLTSPHPPIEQCGVLIEEFECLPADAEGSVEYRVRSPFLSRVVDLATFG